MVLCHKNFNATAIGYVYLYPDSQGRCGVYVREGDDNEDYRRYRRAMNGADDAASRSAARPSPASANGNSHPHDPAESLRVWREHIAKGPKLLPVTSPQAKSWADRLGLPDPAVFGMIETAWLEADDYNRGELLAFPERDGAGKVIGYSTRYLVDGRKLAVGQRGIIIPRALTPTSRPADGPIFLVEGASDTLVLATMGFNAIGRPSNTGGADYIVEFLRRLPREWCDGSAQNYLPQLVVVGENDRKENGDWPGSYGAFRLAHRLTTDLGFPVRVVFPPSSHKDVRDWFQAEMKRCAGKPFRFSLAAYVAGSWDQHVYESSVVVRPGDPPPESSHPTTGPSQPPACAAAPPAPPPDLSDLAGDAIPNAVRAGRPQRTPEQLAAEEAAAAEAVRAMQRDFNRFPCRCCRKIVLEHKRTSEDWLIEVRCQKRGCPGCRAFLDDREVVNATLRFKTAERAGETLYRFDVAPELWRSLRSAIRKAGGQYLRVISPEGFRVWTNVVVGKPWRSSPARAVIASGALADLASLLTLYDRDKRPVTTSHGWALPKEDEPSRQFRRIGKGDPSLTAADVLEIADEAGAIPVLVAPKKPNGNIFRMWRFVFPGGRTEEAREQLHAGLYAGQAVPLGVSAGGYVGERGGRGGMALDDDHDTYDSGYDPDIDLSSMFAGL